MLNRCSKCLTRFFAHRYAPLAAFLLLAAVGAFLFTVQLHRLNGQQNRLNGAETELHNNVQYNCHRLNQILVDDNVSHKIDYTFDTQTLKFFKIPPTAPESAGVRKLVSQEVEILENEAKDKDWVPLINCSQVHSTQYLLPKPISFAKEAPPKSVLATQP